MKSVIIPLILLAFLATDKAKAQTINDTRSSQSISQTTGVAPMNLQRQMLDDMRAHRSNYKHTHKKKKARRTYRGRVFVFDPRRHMWYAYSGGRVIASGRAAGGAGYCRDIRRSCRTPVGHFRIIRKGSANCRSGTYPKPRGGARMDYCMFFSKYYAIHGSNNVPAANVSHGCIRVKPKAARWLHRNFLHYGTRVIVRSY